MEQKRLHAIGARRFYSTLVIKSTATTVQGWTNQVQIFHVMPHVTQLSNLQGNDSSLMHQKSWRIVWMHVHQAASAGRRADNHVSNLRRHAYAISLTKVVSADGCTSQAMVRSVIIILIRLHKRLSLTEFYR